MIDQITAVATEVAGRRLGVVLAGPGWTVDCVTLGVDWETKPGLILAKLILV